MDTIIEVSGEGTERMSTNDSIDICADQTSEDCDLETIFGNEVVELSDEAIRALTFESIELAGSFYRQYANVKGFGVRRSKQLKNPSNNELTMKQFVCDKEGLREKQWTERNERIREPKSVTRTGCKARIRFIRRNGIWAVSLFESEHNHVLVVQKQRKFIRSRRRISDAEIEEAQSLRAAGIRPSNIMRFFAHQVGGVRNLSFTRTDLKNRLNRALKKPVAGGQVDAVMTYFLVKSDTDPGFFFEHTVDDEGILANVFWTDSRSRSDYACFGDVVAFDTTYKKNSFDIPLTVFVGVNHHHSSIIFGFALLATETADSYRWLLSTFLRSMHGKMPRSVVTDGDRAMAVAIHEVFLGVRHRLCTWHIEQNAKKNIHQSGFLRDFSKCMFAWWTPDRFEEEWVKLVDKYNLQDNAWMIDKYVSKSLWAQSYITGHFFATFKTTARCEGMNSFIQKYVCQYGLPLYEFVRLLDTVLERIRETEAENDYKSEYTKPLIQHPVAPIEKHAADVYTRASFFRFRKELVKECLYFEKERVETGHICTYKLIKYQGRNEEVSVIFDSNAQTIRCSCMRFETIGIPCRHQICVMKMAHMNKIPDSCILSRWTMNAKQDAHEWVDTSVDPEIMRSAQFASFISQCTRLYYNAQKTKDGLTFAKNEIAKLGAQVREMGTLRERENAGSRNPALQIRDPPTPKQKRKARERHKDNVAVSKQPRKCAVCRHEGHTKRTCPTMELSLGSMSTRRPESRDVDIDTSDEERMNANDECSFVEARRHTTTQTTTASNYRATEYTFISTNDFAYSNADRNAL